MRDVYIKKASQDEQQSHTTTTKNIYIKNFMSLLKKSKLNNKVKTASNKTGVASCT